jgi:hypothetical protein
MLVNGSTPLSTRDDNPFSNYYQVVIDSRPGGRAARQSKISREPTRESSKLTDGIYFYSVQPGTTT